MGHHFMMQLRSLIGGKSFFFYMHPNQITSSKITSLWLLLALNAYCSFFFPIWCQTLLWSFFIISTFLFTSRLLDRASTTISSLPCFYLMTWKGLNDLHQFSMLSIQLNLSFQVLLVWITNSFNHNYVVKSPKL